MTNIEPSEQYDYEAWETLVARRVLDEARRLRKAQHLSAQDVSMRLRSSGWPLSVNTVNGMFGAKGRQSITVPQLMALADTFGVPAIQLLYPPQLAVVETRPGQEHDPLEAIDLFVGAENVARRERPLDNLELLKLRAEQAQWDYVSAQVEENLRRSGGEA